MSPNQPTNTPDPTNTPPANPLEFGIPDPTPTPPAPAADDMPKWAQDFTSSITEKINSLEATITPADDTPPSSAPIGATQPTESELSKLNPQTWDDVDKYVNSKIQQGVEQGINQFQTNITKTAEANDKARQEVDAELDAAVDSLQRENLIPAIANPNDRNDPGRIARRELYGAAAKLGTTDLKAVATLTLAPLHAQGKMYDPISDSIIANSPQQPGANAPIGSSSATTGQSSNTPDYATIRKARSFDELRARAGM